MIEQLKNNIKTKGTFSFNENVKAAWKGFKANPGSLIGFLTVATILFYLSIITLAFIPIIGWIALFIFISPAANALFGGFYIVAKKIAYDQTINFSDYFQGFRHFSKLLGLYAIIFLISLPINAYSYSFMDIQGIFNMLSSGSLDLNSLSQFALENKKIPGYISTISSVFSIIVSLITLFALPAIIVSGLSTIDAIKLSFEIFKKYWLQLIVSLIFLVVVNIFGALICGLGLLVSVPFSSLFMYYTYQNITATKVIEEEKEQFSTFGLAEKDINTESQEG